MEARSDDASRARVLILAVIAVVAVVVATFVVLGGRGAPAETATPDDLTSTAIEGVASAPGIEYRISVLVDYGGGDRQGIDSTGTVDFTTGRFSGTADSGGGPFMLLFGGPKSGAAVIADGRFVKTENGPWEQVADVPHPFERMLDRAVVSEGLRRALRGVAAHPTVGSVACGSETCRTVNLVVLPAGVSALITSLFGDNVGEIPADLVPIPVVLHIDEVGFLRHFEAHGAAGTTTFAVTVDLTRLDTPPSIDRPIP